MRTSSVWAAALTLAAAVSSISPLTTKGSKFFDSDGNQFFLKGVAYQRSEADPLLDTTQCQLDAKAMKDLGANAIRVYHVEDGDHDGCMKAFSDAGIYLFVDLDTFSTYILQEDPFFNQTQLHAYQAVMDQFHAYDNTAGFFVGNEILTQNNHSEVAVLIKSATANLKAYRDSKGYRKIPVGYSHADISTLRPILQNYLACGTNRTESVDFFGLNAYEWCGQTNYKLSGYQDLTNQIMGYPVPIFFSETGCIVPRPRTFDDQAAIFGPQMAPYWSGAIIYEWIQEENGYGLITYGGSTQADVSVTSPVRSGTPTPMVPDYSNLKKAWAAVTPSGVKSSAYAPSVTTPPCPAYTPNVWNVNGDVKLPSVGATLDASATASITGGGGSRTSGGATTSPTAGGSPTREIAGASAGLLSVLVGFLVWL